MLNTFMENFELILTLAVLVCLVFYIYDSFGYLKERKRLTRAFSQNRETSADRQRYLERLAAVAGDRRPEKLPAALLSAREKLAANQPLGKEEMHWLRKPAFRDERFIEFFSGTFWILFIIWVIRSFLFEPFRIPSGSMEPNLYDGDFILTSKFSYGIKLPVLGTKITAGTPVQRGDVVVFKYPQDPKLNYIKRIVGLPGDQLKVVDGRLWINGEEQKISELHPSPRQPQKTETLIGEEQLGERRHQLQFYPRESQEGTREMTVPPGHYFAMGDNRDGSLDSRAWGYVPEQNLVGKALFIWMNGKCVIGQGDCNRIGQAIK